VSASIWAVSGWSRSNRITRDVIVAKPTAGGRPQGAARAGAHLSASAETRIPALLLPLNAPPGVPSTAHEERARRRPLESTSWALANASTVIDPHREGVARSLSKHFLWKILRPNVRYPAALPHCGRLTSTR
jgi:hypothetical protein